MPLSEDIASTEPFEEEKLRSLMSSTADGETFHWYRTK